MRHDFLRHSIQKAPMRNHLAIMTDHSNASEEHQNNQKEIMLTLMPKEKKRKENEWRAELLMNGLENHYI